MLQNIEKGGILQEKHFVFNAKFTDRLPICVKINGDSNIEP